jgi:hypothetical protein
MSLSIAGCSGLPCCWLMRQDRAGTRRVIGGSSMRRQGRRALDLSVSGDRPVWPSHRCPGLPEAGSGGHSPILYPCLHHRPRPAEVSTNRAPAYPQVLDELLPSACHVVEQYASNPVETDHGRLKAWLRPMRGLKQLRSVRVISVGHAFIQNVRRGHYELATEVDHRRRLATAFAELALAV